MAGKHNLNHVEINQTSYTMHSPLKNFLLSEQNTKEKFEMRNINLLQHTQVNPGLSYK